MVLGLVIHHIAEMAVWPGQSAVHDELTNIGVADWNCPTSPEWITLVQMAPELVVRFEALGSSCLRCECENYLL